MRLARFNKQSSWRGGESTGTALACKKRVRPLRSVWRQVWVEIGCSGSGSPRTSMNSASEYPISQMSPPASAQAGRAIRINPDHRQEAVMAASQTKSPALWTSGDWNAFFGFATNILVNMLVLTGLLRFVLKLPDSLVF